MSVSRATVAAPRLPTTITAVADPTWQRIREEALEAARAEPLIAGLIEDDVLRRARLDDAMAAILARKLSGTDLHASLVLQAIDEAFTADAAIGAALRADLVAVNERDPACCSYLKPLLLYKGFQALQTHRVAHHFWRNGRQVLALLLQSRAAEVFAVDIHPAAQLGSGILIDHGTGVVVGETAVIEDNVSMLQGVTLGGTGKEMGDRHPKIRQGVLLGAGAKVLGNIEIGAYAKIGAGSVVLMSVPARCTAAGVPAKLVGECGCAEPARDMDHYLPMDG